MSLRGVCAVREPIMASGVHILRSWVPAQNLYRPVDR